MTQIDYNLLMRRALQRIVGDVLEPVAETGELPGEHHFYISFLTQSSGVDIPAHLASQYPEEMTIVIQNWFDNLMVMDDRFGITLSFGGKAENLVVPFHAITGFADPSVNFSLRFEAMVEEEEEELEAGDAEIIDDMFDHEHRDHSPIDDDATHEDAKVISFDKFRKP